jgi:hypothetical protein
MELSRQSDLSAASFLYKDVNVTEGQRALLHLLHDRISNKMPITQEDIIDLYFDVCSKNGRTIRIRKGMNWNQVTTAIEADKDHPEVRYKARQWFMNNLGNCIIKGKLLVIPVIEID